MTNCRRAVVGGLAPANAITNDVFDPVTSTAEYKCCAARIEKL